MKGPNGAGLEQYYRGIAFGAMLKHAEVVYSKTRKKKTLRIDMEVPKKRDSAIVRISARAYVWR